MDIEYEAIIKARIPAFSGRDSRNNRLIIETLALHGPLIKYDIFKILRSTGIEHYSTISRRVDNMVKRGYLGVAGTRMITVGKRREESSTYSLTWRGFIASLTSKAVSENIPAVFEKNPLLQFNLPYNVPKDLLINVIKELFTPREISILANAILLGFLKALPRDVESIKEENYITYVVPAFTEVPEIKEEIQERDWTRLLEIPGVNALLLDLVEKYEKQVRELLKGLRIIKKELTRHKTDHPPLLAST